MSYFPILSTPSFTGFTTLYNFSPNNWERFTRKDRYIYLSYIKDGKWHHNLLDVLKYKDNITINYADIKDVLPHSYTLPLLSLNNSYLPNTTDTLPILDMEKIHIPEYRATLGISSKFTTTSYQGEINPFPAKASLLTLCSFMQFGSEVQNYALILNVENAPQHRESMLEVYDFVTKERRAKIGVLSNTISTISLDDLGFDKASLPFLVCKTMAAIPLFLSSSKDGHHLSMEHTHPPASLVVHGNRFQVQGSIKKQVFNRFTYE